MSLLCYTCVCHTCVSPPFHNETDPRHLEHVSDLEQSVYKVCMHLRRFSDILNPRGWGVQVLGTCLLVDMTCHE